MSSHLMLGLTAGGEKVPLQVDTAGKMVTDLTFSGSVSIGTVAISQTGNENRVVVFSSALPTGAATETTSAAILAKLLTAPATEAKQDTTNTTLSTINGKITAINTGAVVVSSSALPTGAATAAKQPALGTAGASSSDVISVQGIASGTALLISGSVTATPLGNSMSVSSAYEASRVIKASRGSLYSLTGFNSGPAQFLQLFDLTALPADGTAPFMLLGIPALSSFAFTWPAGIYGNTGLVICNSTTGPTKTIGAANCYFTAGYV